MRMRRGEHSRVRGKHVRVRRGTRSSGASHPRWLGVISGAMLIVFAPFATVVTNASLVAAAAPQWTPTEAPASAVAATPPYQRVYAVSCAGSGFCVAVGNENAASGGIAPLVDVLSGDSWAPVAVSFPSDAAISPKGGLSAVSCSAANSCVALGEYSKATLGDGLFAETLSNGTWKVSALPVPAEFLSLWDGPSLSCPTVGFCAAVGVQYQPGNGSGSLAPFTETFSNGSWTASIAPLPSNATNIYGLDSVSCPAQSSCVAVGQYVDSSGYEGFADALSGTSWTSAELPVPSDAAASPDASATAVSCAASGSCVAVGSYATASVGDGLIEILSNGVWTPLKAPLPSDSGNNPSAYLDTVSCGTSTFCVATGLYSDSSSNRQGAIETLSGGSWTPTEAPVPANAQPGLGDLVDSCAPGTSSCVATSQYTDTSGNQQGQLDTLSGGVWTTTEAPLPTNAGSAPHVTLSNSGLGIPLSCSGSGTCAAVGSYVDTTGTQEGLIESAQIGTSAPPPPPNSLQANIYLCNAQGSPTTTVVRGGYLTANGPEFFVSKSTMSEANVNPGTYTISANAPPGYIFVSCGQASSPSNSIHTLGVPPGGTTNFFVESNLPPPILNPTDSNGIWSGYLVEGANNSDAKVTVVVPTVNCQFGYEASFWVGYGGAGGLPPGTTPVAPSLEQMGLTGQCSSLKKGPATYSLWWELVSQKDHGPYGTISIPNFTLQPGDSVAFDVTHTSVGVGFALHVTYPSGRSGPSWPTSGFYFPPLPLGFNPSYGTTECIAENPRPVPLQYRLALPKFGTVDLSGCSAISAVTDGLVPGDALWRMNMISSKGQPMTRTNPITLDSSHTNHFSVTWISRGP